MDRRKFLLSATAFTVSSAPVLASLGTPTLRGTIDASHLGMRPGAVDDQSRTLQKAIKQAVRDERPLYLPPGRYHVSNLTLPSGAHIVGVPGATRLTYGGRGHLMFAEGAERVRLQGLTFDGVNRPLGAHVSGLVHIRESKRLIIDDCEVLGSTKHGITLERVEGRINHTRITGATEAGIYSVEANGLEISSNTVADCGNGGILVHRWKQGEDATIVTSNRIERIQSTNGGTGQFGNGINIFRANNVIVSNNRIADCAFTAVRSNAGSNVQIIGNNCMRSGETGIFSEFEFQGAIVSNNIVDGAANGIVLANFMQGGRMGVVSGNVVRNMKTTAPYYDENETFGNGIFVEADTTVTGNVIENAPAHGLLLGWGPYLRNVSATGNVIRDARVGISVSVVEGARSTVIADNIIRSTREGAIVGYRWHKPVTRDLAVSGADKWSHLSILRNRVS